MLPYQLHQKLRAAQQQRTGSSSNPSILRGQPFWIWSKEEHRQQAAATNGQCCFNHVVGLPTKDKKEYPLLDYEKILYDSLINCDDSSLFKNRHLWVKKATGLGVTEFMLRMIAWLCIKLVKSILVKSHLTYYQGEKEEDNLANRDTKECEIQ